MNTLAVNYCQLLSIWLDELDLQLVNQWASRGGVKRDRAGTDFTLEIGK